MVAGSLVVTGTLALLGFLYAVDVVGWPRFALNREYTPASTWSAVLLLLAAAAAARTASGSGAPGRWVLAGLFAYMAVDEEMAIHEALERATGVDWQTLFAPVIAVAAIAFVWVVRGIDRREVRWLLVAGAAAWGTAQLFEKLEWHGAVPQPHYKAFMLSEETLEMLGSTLFATGFAVLAVLAATHRPRAREVAGSPRALTRVKTREPV